MNTWAHNNTLREAEEMDYTLKFKEAELGYDVLRVRHFKASSDLEALLKVIENVDVGFELDDMKESDEFAFDDDWTVEHVCEYIEDTGYLTDFELKNDTTDKYINTAAFLNEIDEKTVNW